MKRTTLFTVALVYALAGAAAVKAQDNGTPSAAPPATTGPASGNSLSKDTLIGRDAYSQDQTLMGPVVRVSTTSDGRVQAIFIRTGGFLGIGARLVSVPDGKFQMRGQNVQLQLTSDDVQKLPSSDGS